MCIHGGFRYNTMPDLFLGSLGYNPWGNHMPFFEDLAWSHHFALAAEFGHIIYFGFRFPGHQQHIEIRNRDKISDQTLKVIFSVGDIPHDCNARLATS